MIALGIYLQGSAAGLLSTLDTIPLGRTDLTVTLLLDGLLSDERAWALDVAKSYGLAHMDLGSEGGGARAWNRLIAEQGSSVYGLVEVGCQFAEGAWERLFETLNEGNVGLVGPSTNRCWNEQGCFPEWNQAPLDLRAAAARAAQCDEVKELAPLYSLAAFCWLVRAEVVQAVGVADEGYEDGPCWEMDYNVRAARLGFRGLWVRAAFVFRPLPTVLCEQREQRLFDAARRRYQDKFCALRVENPRRAYANHCLGDACSHFARAEQTRLFEAKRLLPQARVVASQPSSPLVSCIAPTVDRIELLERSVELFLRQSWPNRELLIVEQGNYPVAQLCRRDERIRAIRVLPKLSIGAKRNVGCEHAHGQYLLQWDDDDWYGSERISAQVAPLLSGEADVSAIAPDLFFHLDSGQFWRVTDELRRRMFYEDVLGGSIAFSKALWEKSGRFPSRNLAEDAALLANLLGSGYRLARIPNADHYVYVRHGANTWMFASAAQGGTGWYAGRAPASMSEQDLAFYQEYAEQVLGCARWPLQAAQSIERSEQAPPWLPQSDVRVSCIMPTRARRTWAMHALHYFARQTWSNRELIVVEDGPDNISDLIPAAANVRYVRSREGATIGEKRNLACDLATGELILHWDDDDWYAPWRIEYQVWSLLRGRAELSGLKTLLYFEPAAQRGFQFVYPEGAPFWLAGGSLCYRKALWARRPFHPLNVGEDNEFVAAHSNASSQVLQVPDFYVGMIHSGNTSPKEISGARWLAQPQQQIVALLGADAARYAAAEL
jgi:O-antigen biosynthesis protein